MEKTFCPAICHKSQTVNISKTNKWSSSRVVGSLIQHWSLGADVFVLVCICFCSVVWMFSALLAAGEVSVFLALFLVRSCQNLDPVDPNQFHHQCVTESHCYSAKRVRENLLCQKYMNTTHQMEIKWTVNSKTEQKKKKDLEGSRKVLLSGLAL